VLIIWELATKALKQKNLASRRGRKCHAIQTRMPTQLMQEVAQLDKSQI